MKTSKSIKGNFAAKLFSGFVFVIASFITIFSFICIVYMTICGAYDSSKEAAINSMRDSVYGPILQNYKKDVLNLCIYGDKDASIFDDTNFRFIFTEKDSGDVIMTNCSSSDSEYIYRTKYTFRHMIEQTDYVEEDNEVVTTFEDTICVLECFVNGRLDKADQFAFIDNFVSITYSLRYIAILVCISGAFAVIAAFLFLMSTAGYHGDSEMPYLTWFDKVSLEFIACILVLLAAGEILLLDSISQFSVSMFIWAMLIVLFDVTVLIIVATSIAARFRCKSFVKTTFIYAVLKGIFLLMKKVFDFFVKVLSYVPALWKLILAVGLVCFAEFCLLLLWGIDDLPIIFVFERLLFIPIIFYVAYMLYKLEETSKKIAAGDISATVDTKYFIGTMKKQGENLNSIKLGIAQAVDDKMKSERFKTELITNVSHDIKTPLTSIINYVDLLDKEDLQNERAKEYIQIISKHSDRLKKLVVDLVDASKASSGVLKLDMQPMKIDVLLEQIAGEYTERLAANNMDLIVRTPEESIQIMADGQRIYRVFDNLMNNICKYALPNTRVYLVLEKKDDKAIISFKNISATELDMSANDLMERFVRGDKSRNTEGSGLGLSIAESLTNLQNGTFNIQLDGDLFKVILTFPVIDAQ